MPDLLRSPAEVADVSATTVVSGWAGPGAGAPAEAYRASLL